MEILQWYTPTLVIELHILDFDRLTAHQWPGTQNAALRISIFGISGRRRSVMTHEFLYKECFQVDIGGFYGVLDGYSSPCLGACAFTGFPDDSAIFIESYVQMSLLRPVILFLVEWDLDSGSAAYVVGIAKHAKT